MLTSKFATLQDNSTHGDDNFLIRDLGNNRFLDVVMDGVTGHGGDEASRTLKEALEQATINSIDDVEQVLRHHDRRQGLEDSPVQTTSAAVRRGRRNDRNAELQRRSNSRPFAERDGDQSDDGKRGLRKGL